MLINIPKIIDPRGNLSVLEPAPQGVMPFPIARVFWIYDVPGGECRGGHAHYECREVIVALSGSFSVTTDDGHGHRRTYHLNHPYQGLVVDAMTWRTLDDFSSGAVCLCLASHEFDLSDYIYSYDDFLRQAEQRAKGR